MRFLNKEKALAVNVNKLTLARFYLVKNTMNEGTSELVERFDIDDGLLQGITPEYVFALGV